MNDISSVHAHTIIGKGKTKIIRRIFSEPGMVFIESMDDITAGDGAKRDVLEGKAVWSTETTSNCFQLLERNGVKTHYIGPHDPCVFRAREARMIPIECIARRIATGTYLKRNPKVAQGTRFETVVVEFNYKDDAAHDPYMVWEHEEKRFLLYDLKRPISDVSFIRELTPDEIFRKKHVRITTEVLTQMQHLTAQTFTVLEAAWTKLGVTLVDLKIECGVVGSKDEVVVADVIDNDSWRIWPDGDKSQQLDKQSYRELVEAPTPEDIAKLKGNYARVAELTRSFLKD